MHSIAALKHQMMVDNGKNSNKIIIIQIDDTDNG